MSGIFISYRRSDTSGYVGRLYPDLVRAFGRDRVFMDIDTLTPGRDFTAALDHAVTTCDVLIALIGPAWLHAQDEHGNRRLDDPEDWVRREIAKGLEREDILVIPVLVGNARMPRQADLPDDLKRLTNRHAFSIDDGRSWSFDVKMLIDELKHMVKPARSPMLDWVLRPLNLVATGVLLGLTVGLAVVLYTMLTDGDSPNEGNNSNDGPTAASDVAQNAPVGDLISSPGSLPTPTPEPSPTAEPTRTPSPEPTPGPSPTPTTALGDVLYEDDFDDPEASSLPTESWDPEVSRYGFVEGAYVIEKVDPDARIGPYTWFGGTYRDVVVTVDAWLVGETKGRYVFVSCRHDPVSEYDTFYRLVVEPDGGRVLIERRVEGASTTLVEDFRPDVMKPGNAVNHLELRCVGTEISGSVNGVEVVRVEDGALPHGAMNIGAGANTRSLPATVEARFDNLLVTEPIYSEETKEALQEPAAAHRSRETAANAEFELRRD